MAPQYKSQVTYIKMLSCRKQSVLIKAMDRFVKKILTGKILEIKEAKYKKSSGDFLNEKKSFASFRWRPVDGKTFVFYIQIISLLKR